MAEPESLELDPRRQLASLPFAVVVLAPGQVIASVNPAAEAFFGQSLRRLAGQPLATCLRLIDPGVTRHLTRGEAPLSAYAVDAVVAGHAMRRLDVTLAPLIDHPGWQMLTLHDNVPRLNADAEVLGDAASDSDIALRGPEVLAHEIKNPLAAIRGAAQLLAREASAEARDLTRLIADEVDRIARLIDQMQTLSRRTSVTLGACNLHEVVRRASAILTAASPADTPAPRIEEAFDPSLPLAMGNPHALVQVLINLIVNAREASQAMPNPRIVVRTRFAPGLQRRATASAAPVRLPIELRVSDNGPGVDPALRDHIFEPFVSGKANGQGLGLALVRKLVREMNGSISHDRDEAGGWTHFRLHVQQAPADAGEGAPL